MGLQGGGEQWVSLEERAIFKRDAKIEFSIEFAVGLHGGRRAVDFEGETSSGLSWDSHGGKTDFYGKRETLDFHGGRQAMFS